MRDSIKVAKRQATKRRRVASRQEVQEQEGSHWEWPCQYWDWDWEDGWASEPLPEVQYKDSGWSLERPQWMAELGARVHIRTLWERLLEPSVF